MNEPLFTFADDQRRPQRRFVVLPADRSGAAPVSDGSGRHASGRRFLLAGIARWLGRPPSDSAAAAR